MRFTRPRLSHALAAGAFGGLVNSLLIWGSGRLGLTAMLQVRIAPPLTAAWLYPRLVWGGLWGLLLLLPIAASARPLKRGLILSLFPTLFQLFVVFPYWAHQGQAGLGLGTLTPLLVLVANAAWGVAAAVWYGRGA